MSARQHPTGAVQALMLKICSDSAAEDPFRGLTPADWSLIRRIQEKANTAHPYELELPIWRAGHRRPEIAQAMRGAGLDFIRELSAQLDAAAAAAAIERVMKGRP